MCSRASTQVPVWSAGEFDETPTRAAQLSSGYEVGASLLLGHLHVLQRESAGFDNELRVSDVGSSEPFLRLEMAGSAGQIEVTRP